MWIRDAEDKKAKNAIVKNLKLIYFKLIDLNLQPFIVHIRERLRARLPSTVWEMSPRSLSKRWK